MMPWRRSRLASRPYGKTICNAAKVTAEREGVVVGGDGGLTRFLHGTDYRFGPAQLAKGRPGAGSLAAFRMQLQRLQRLQRGTRTATRTASIFFFCCSAQPGSIVLSQPAPPSACNR
jgi:hypothetical protein